jgi:hypothetical protein
LVWRKGFGKWTKILEGEMTKDIYKNMRLDTVGVGIKFNRTLNIKQKDIDAIYHKLRSNSSTKISHIAYSDNKNSAIIFGKNEKRQIFIDSSAIDYKERGALRKNSFEIKKIIKEIIDCLFTDYFDIGDIKIIGKYFEYSVKLDEYPANFLLERFKLFSNSNISRCFIRPTVVLDDKNVHFHFEGLGASNIDIDEEDEEDIKKILSVKVDINNHDQYSKLPEGYLEKIIDFADDFIKNKLGSYIEELEKI